MSEIIVEYIGEQLQSARRKLGLSPAQAAERLRIRAMFVEALEREEWATIGEFVYVRGFLKNYAKLLGLDAQRLAQRLADEYAPEVAAERPAAALSGSGLSGVRLDDDTARSRRYVPWVLGSLTVLAAALVIMVFVGLIGMLAGTSRSSNGQQALAPNQFVAAPQATAVQSALDIAGDSQGAGGTGVNLRLQLTQASWLSVAVDGKRVVYETLPAGTIRDFHGVREITLRAGNAGGVVAKIDGRDLGRLGAAGQVQDRVFAVKPSPDQFKTIP